MMQIEALRLVITESDLNDLVVEFLPPHEKIADLRVGIVPQGIRVTGIYHWSIGIPFETLWEVFVCDEKLAVRLLTLKTGFLSLRLAKSYMVAAIAAAAKMLELNGDMLLVDVDALFRDRGLCLRTNLKIIRCHYATLEIGCSRSD